MVTHQIPALMSEDEFVAWCDKDTRAEFVDGEVIIMSPESGASEDVRWSLGAALLEIVKMRGLGVVRGPNFQMRLRGGLRRVPDILFISAHRKHLIAPNHLDGAPDVAMEIVSEESSDRDRRQKFQEYESAGIPEYWIIDPLQQLLEAYRLNEAGRYEPLTQQDGAVHSKAVEGFWLRPEWVWEEPKPGVMDLLQRMDVLTTFPTS